MTSGANGVECYYSTALDNPTTPVQIGASTSNPSRSIPDSNNEYVGGATVFVQGFHG